jgi:putative PIN family toxin of toxin-antitoxin system
MAIRAVIDTNVLVASLSSRSEYHWLIRQLLEEKIDLYVTGEIILEYEEVLKIKYSFLTANHFLHALKELPNVYFTEIYFRWKLLKDEDDNKFADCYIAAGAQYLLTHDRGFNILKELPFPQINVISLHEFEKAIAGQ